VAAPRGVELNEGIGGGVLGDLGGKVAGGEDGDLARGSGGPLGLGVGLLLDKADEVILGPSALVLLRLLRVAGGEELESRETAEGERRAIRRGQG
jgi:hypothetical protein